MKKNHGVLLAVCAIACGFSTSAGADVARSLTQTPPSPVPWQFEWDARLRHEQVDDAGFSRNANATSLRARLGVRADFGGGWNALLEGAGVASADNHYNSGANGRTRYPAITDPRGSQLNQAWLGWRGRVFVATLGRQRLQLDNQRWVGNSGWRQFEQTFDALALQWQPSNDWSVRYDWLNRAYRVAGPDALNPLARQRRLDTHLLNAAYVRGAQNWVGYAYLHEDKDVNTASTATYGLRWTGSRLRQHSGPGWTVEFATQSDYANNPASYTTRYWLLEPSWTQRSFVTRLGWEHLSGDGRHALQTPLATLHGFNGWDDQFNVTPVRGLEDRYLGVNGKLAASGAASKWAWAVTYHDYRADQGGRYGREWDASLGFPLPWGMAGLLKLANYQAERFGRDNARVWLQLEWRGQRALGTHRQP